MCTTDLAETRWTQAHSTSKAEAQEGEAGGVEVDFAERGAREAERGRGCFRTSVLSLRKPFLFYLGASPGPAHPKRMGRFPVTQLSSHGRMLSEPHGRTAKERTATC